ncbi:hypothetical protein BY458DRAFT_136729 [Sporodiniella umbellata]|nr:hypothetical protein BY458DRAFT_136729 [Sporodiniella umbellata]
MAYEKVHEAANIMHVQLVKRKPSPEDNFRSKRLPCDILGVCWTNYGNEFTNDAALGNALMGYGQAQSKLASCQDDFANSMKYEYLDKLDEGMTHFKDYQNIRRKLESRRLDYDSKLSRLQKSKKEKPELEQEVQSAKIKYEEAEYDVMQKLASLQDFEDEHYQAISRLLELQEQHLVRSLEIVQQAKSNWGKGQASARQTKLTSVSRSDYSGSRQGSTDSVQHSSAYVPTPVIQKPSFMQEEPSTYLPTSIAKKPSFTHEHSPVYVPNSIVKKPSIIQENLPRQTPPPPPPSARKRSQSTLPKRKALYDFAATSEDELSFKTNDIVQVIEEVDEGWWLGELNGKRGIFPVNYTEPITQGPPVPSRPPVVSSSSSRTQSSVYEEESPFQNRTPPSLIQSSRSSTASRTAPNTPQSRATPDYFAACGDCGCDDFAANVFKKGHCNNCFHKH